MKTHEGNNIKCSSIGLCLIHLLSYQIFSWGDKLQNIEG